MSQTLSDIINSYDAAASLERAATIPASWYTEPRIFDLERQTVFAQSWQRVGRVDQLAQSGQYVTATIADEPVVVVRGSDAVLRGFFNVCRHHAAAVMTEAEGTAQSLRCPYHGWTYSLEGALKGTPDFTGVCDFDRAANGLVPLETSLWGQWIFARISRAAHHATSVAEHELNKQIGALALDRLHWMERRHYHLECNWKVFVDNYLDGGYHVPHLHRGLDSVLDYSNYRISNGERFCLQSSPMTSEGAEPETGAVRQGRQALYYWIYPNFMINWYEGAMDTNLVIPRGIDRTEVIFDFYFADVSPDARARNQASIDVGERIQHEDEAICRSVQQGLNSRAYHAGRLSVRREAGEHLFHRLLHADLQAGLNQSMKSSA